LKLQIITYMLDHPEITAEEIAEMSGFCITTIRAWMRAGSFKPHIRGRRTKAWNPPNIKKGLCPLCGTTPCSCEK